MRLAPVIFDPKRAKSSSDEGLLAQGSFVRKKYFFKKEAQT
jgi:hypothetical protein